MGKLEGLFAEKISQRKFAKIAQVSTSTLQYNLNSILEMYKKNPERLEKIKKGKPY